MVVHGFKIKLLVISFTCISVFVPWIRADGALTNEMPTFLMPVDYRNNDENNNNPQDDTSAQESVKIEHRQLYDTVKHASGYDPDANNNARNTTEETIDKINSSTVKTFLSSRKSAVIQAIPRKVRGPGTTISSTTTALPFARPPSLHTAAKDYGTGEPTTTIVYATSIPTTPSRAYVNIRPVPLLSTHKYRSTIADINKQEKNQDTDNTKPVIETYSQDQEQQQEQKSQVNVLEKPSFKIESSSEQETTTPRSFETTPYQIEQRNRYLEKSLPYTRVRANEDRDEIMPEYNRNTLVNLHPNHKWSNEDYIQRAPIQQQFLYENHQGSAQNYYQPPPVNQNHFSPRYPAPQDDYQDEMYRDIPAPLPSYMPQHQQSLASMFPMKQQQYQQYQPLTIRDFDLLLQLLVLRERRLHASQDPYSSSSGYNSGLPTQEESNPYYDMTKAQLPENHFFKSRDPNSLLRSIQSSNVRLLPSNVREELLFRMLLLALHLQPQPPKLMSVPRNPPTPILPPAYMYLGSSASAPSASPSTSASGAFLGFRQRSPNTKNPVRSVQVLGEIE